MTNTGDFMECFRLKKLKKRTIAIYVRNKNNNPSGYYRICQYLDDLGEEIVLRSLTSDRFNWLSINCKHRWMFKIFLELEILLRATIYLLSDCITVPKTVFIQREITPRWQPIYISMLIKIVSARSRIIWDIDDDIFYNKEISKREKRMLEENASVIIVSNKKLIRCVQRKNRQRIIFLPTTDRDIDLQYSISYISKRIEIIDKGRIDLLWLGSSSGLGFITSVLLQLEYAAWQLRKNGIVLTLRIVSGIKYEKKTKYLRIENIVWDREKAVYAVLNSQIGIMPLTRNRFTESKGGFKLIQYLSGGLPVIATEVGLNRDIVDENCGYLVRENANIDEWYKKIESIVGDKVKYRKYCENARKRWEENFSYKGNLKVLKEVFNNDKDY